MTRPAEQLTELQEPAPEGRTQELSELLEAIEKVPREHHDRRMRMHLSAMPPGKSDLDTHLGITIRWPAPPGIYPPVAYGRVGAGRRAGDRFGCLTATAFVMPTGCACGGGASC